MPVRRQRGQRQSHQLGCAQTARVEQLENGDQTQTERTGPLPAGGDQGLDLRLIEQAGQRPLPARTVDGLGRIVRAPALQIDKAMELADGREAAGGGRRRHAAPRQLAQIGAHRRVVRTLRAETATLEKAKVIGQIAPIGVQGVPGRAALDRHHFEEDFYPGLAWHGGRAQRSWISAVATAMARASRSRPTRPSARRQATSASGCTSSGRPFSMCST